LFRDIALPPFVLATAGPVRLRTLVLVRWVAIAGQLATVLVVALGFRVALPLDALFAAIAASAALNLGLTLWRPQRRLDERATAFLLAWDATQLAVLLYFTGGLTNPFALLMLAPVTISATVLSPASTVALCALTVAFASALAGWHVPLPFPAAAFGAPPALFVAGSWVAIVLGSVFFALYAGWIASEARRMSAALAATQAALDREQRLAAVGALAAATAHELGTPLNTIALVTKDIAGELTPDDPLAEDVALLEREIGRCRTILRELSVRGDSADGSPLQRLTPAALLEIVAQRYRRPDVAVEITTTGSDVPRLRQSSEIMHGMANIVQNAIQFARARVEIDVVADGESLTIAVADDGPGIPTPILDHLGEPYLSTRHSQGNHMGLGVFIATNLLQRTGATLSFANRAEGGALVQVRWPRSRLAEGQGGRP
jgi:two-component system sensor histidine kinase RegB